MTTHITESVWLNTSTTCSFDYLAEVSGLTEDDLRDLVETGIIEPSNRDPHNYSFHTSCIVVARTARRLRDDFELDTQGLALALNLLRRMDALEAELTRLRAKLAR